MVDWTTLDTRAREFGPTLARIGLALVFLYFGTSQLLDPSSFIGWLPPELNFLPPTTVILFNGAFEVFFGTLLLLGVYTRVSALLLGLHLAGITFTIGYSQIGVRDFGLSIATLAVALYGADRYSIDHRFRKIN